MPTQGEFSSQKTWSACTTPRMESSFPFSGILCPQLSRGKAAVARRLSGNASDGCLYV